MYNALGTDSCILSLHQRLLSLFEKVTIATKSVLDMYTVAPSSSAMYDSYNAYDLLEKRMNFVTLDRYVDSLLLINTVTAKNHFRRDIQTKRKALLENDNINAESVMQSAVVELKDAELLVSRIPKTPEEWAEQVSFRRNRHQFARRIGVNVIDFVLSKIKELEDIFYDFYRDVYGTLLSIHELNKKVFTAARDMEKNVTETMEQNNIRIAGSTKGFQNKNRCNKATINSV